jgi:hypothetical protein
MKINVNVYNEILSYEGTPEELAEFVATGILFPYMDYSEEEECDCEEEQDKSVIVPDAMDAEELVETPKTADEIVDSYKDKIREDLAAEGYVCSDEEFDDAYRVAVEIMGPLKELFE